jgi:hypothetical protein
VPATASEQTDRPHGYARYKLDGCRCYTCGWSVAQYNDARDHAMRRGTWQPWTDAAPVADHLRNLQACGLGLRTTAELAAVDRKRLQAVLTGRPERGTGPQGKVRPALAAAVLAVEPTFDNIPAHTPVDATGTRRRLQALVAAGWPQCRLGERLGVTPGNFWKLMQQSQVTAGRLRAVRALYDELWRADPAEHGIDAQAISRARNHARVNTWAPVGAWDEDTIDDPAACPDWTGCCGTVTGYNAHYTNRLLPVCDRCRDAKAESRRTRLAIIEES